MQTKKVKVLAYNEHSGAVRPTIASVTLVAAPWDPPQECEKEAVTDRSRVLRALARSNEPKTAANLARMIGGGISSHTVSATLQHMVTEGLCLKTDYNGGATSQYWLDRSDTAQRVREHMEMFNHIHVATLSDDLSIHVDTLREELRKMPDMNLSEATGDVFWKNSAPRRL